MITKICTKCGKEKLITDFYIKTKSKDGYRPNCKECCIKYSKVYNTENKEKISEKKKIYHKLIENKRKQYYIENKEEISEKQKIYNIENKEKISKKKKIYRLENLEVLKYKHKKYYENNKNEYIENVKNYYENNKDKVKKYQKQYNIENKEKINKSKRNYYEKNIHFFIWRKLLKRTLKQFNNKKTDSTYNILGYSSIELKNHIEKQFTDNMNWSNYGEWHIDHIRPVSTFDKTTHPSIVNALSNLRPMWAVNIEINGIFYEGNLNRKIIKNKYV